MIFNRISNEIVSNPPRPPFPRRIVHLCLSRLQPSLQCGEGALIIVLQQGIGIWTDCADYLSSSFRDFDLLLLAKSRRIISWSGSEPVEGHSDQEGERVGVVCCWCTGRVFFCDPMRYCAPNRWECQKSEDRMEVFEFCAWYLLTYFSFIILIQVVSGDRV